MASKKSATNPYQWSDGTWHSITEQRHIQNEAFKNPAAPNLAQITGASPYVQPDPPVGTYDPAIDYNASASNRGFGQTVNDAQTAYEQGQQDYTLGLGDLTTGKTRSLADLLTGENRLNQDYGFQTGENQRQYGILGRQQSERAAQQGIQSQGLLAKSAQVRGANQARDQGQLDLTHNRGLEDIGTNRTRVGEDFTRGKLGLDLGNARQFGGFNGQSILNPLTNKPEFGSLLTGVTRAGGENNAFQALSSTQRAGQAAQGGYISPMTRLLQQLRGGS